MMVSLRNVNVFSKKHNGMSQRTYDDRILADLARRTMVGRSP
jgi:hypothetical protein